MLRGAAGEIPSACKVPRSVLALRPSPAAWDSVTENTVAARAQWGGCWNGGTFLLQNKVPSALGLVVPVDRMLATETLSGLIIFSELPSEDLNTFLFHLSRERMRVGPKTLTYLLSTRYLQNLDHRGWGSWVTRQIHREREE